MGHLVSCFFQPDLKQLTIRFLIIHNQDDRRIRLLISFRHRNHRMHVEGIAPHIAKTEPNENDSDTERD